jgi:uncharacterized protein YhaN
MRFEKIYITGFGALQNLELGDISPGLNIIEGANEAGKTTMLEFARALFFGFAQRDKISGDARRYLPSAGGAHGGWAILENAYNEKVRIERMGGKTSSGDCNVQLLGTDRDMSIEAVLNGADRMLYEQIFAFSLDELTDFSSSDQRVQNRIYAASSGKQGEFLLDALRRTDEAADKIYLKGGRKPQLNVALAEYRNLQSQIKELSGQVEAYNSYRDQSLKHQQAADDLREQFTLIKKRLERTKLHSDVWETWVRLSALRDELHELPVQSEFDAGKAAQMNDLKIKLQQQQEAMEQLQPRLKRVEMERENCILNPDVLRNAAAIKTIREQLGTYESTLRTLPLEEQKWTASDNQVKVLLEQLGPRWNEEAVEKIDTSRESRLQIQRFEHLLEEQQRNINEALQKESATAQQAAQQRQSLERLRKEIQTEFPFALPQQEELKQRGDALREADALLRAVEMQNLRAEYLQKEVVEKQRQQQQNETPSSLTSFPVWTIFSPLILAILAGVILSREPLMAIFVAALFVIVTVVLWMISRNQMALRTQHESEENLRQQESAKAIDDLQQQLHQCRENITEANSLLQLLNKKWDWKLQSQIDLQRHFDELARDCEKRSRYESLQDDAKRRSDDLEDIQEIQKSQREKIDSLKSTFTGHLDQWNHWLEKRNLSTDVSPRQALDLFDFIEKAREHLQDRAQQQNEIASKKTHCAQFEHAANQLWRELQRDAPDENQLPGAIRALSDELEKQQSLEIERVNLLKNQQQLQDDLEMQNRRWQETTKQIEELLSDAGCADQHEFDYKIAIANRRENLQMQCQEQERILETHSAPGALRERLENELKELDAQCVREQFETAQRDFARTENDLSQANRDQGEWDNKIQQREKDEGKLTALLRQLEMQKTVIADLTQQWAVARLTNMLLDCTRERFEQERQPAVIKRAGELMSNVTAGRYQAVLASRGLNAVELDEGEQGRKPLSRWSRGTKEQFYLALRLAFIEDYCSQEHLEPLPVVMDDVLVHSDGYQRLATTSAMIAAFAEKYQVLYFTCRPGDADVLSQAAPSAKRYKLERGKFIPAT